MPSSSRSSSPVALTLAGGGARGAYEIGALSALLPALDDQELPRIVIGTSVGAINAAYLAAHANLAPAQLVQGGAELWREIGYRRVLEPLLSLSEGKRLWSYLREMLGSHRAHTRSVLDPAPLTHTLGELIPFSQINENIRAGHLDAAAVVATSAQTSTSVVFHDGGGSPPMDDARGIAYVASEIGEDHVRASAAIPLVFPAVPVEVAGERRWFFDGGTRLNTPIKPALALGARRLIVIALNSLAPSPQQPSEQEPDALDGASQLIQAVLIDPLVNDVHTLATVNEMLADDSPERIPEHEARTGRRRVPYILIAPEDPLEIGRVASEIYGAHFKSPFALARSPSLGSLGHLLNAGSSPLHGELLSYLLFAKEFADRLIDLGRRDGERWLAGDHDAGRWQLGPLR